MTKHENRYRLAAFWFLILLAFTLTFVLGHIFSDDHQARVSAELERDLQLERADLIVVSAPVAIIMCGADQKVTVMNPKCEEIFEWTQDELIGKSILKLLPVQDRKTHTASFEKSVKELENCPDRYMIRRSGMIAFGMHKDGHLIPLDISIRAIKYGGRLEFIASFRSIKGSVRKTRGVEDRSHLPDIADRRMEQQSLRHRK